MGHRATFLAISALLLSACRGELPPQSDFTVSGARSAVLSVTELVTIAPRARPTAPVGAIVSAYLARGIAQARSALQGLDALLQIVRGQEEATSSETFALLQEVGNVLTVDIVDELNRSSDRIQNLNAYLRTLQNAIDIAQRRIQELETQKQELADRRKELSNERRKTRRDVDRALNAKEYGAAGELQEKLTDVEGKLAEVQAKEDQTEDILGRFAELLAIAQERLAAIGKNREILLSGLKVIPVPGIEDLMILQENGRYRRSRLRGSRSEE